ncbi:hypothetical protein CUC00_10000 [Prevotella intermedia]|nr:hypothetical protein CTM44_11815 [Prevotella intermedia]ATV41457.1 hypothetical protein CUC00_10000 [Prevotella intermedia]
MNCYRIYSFFIHKLSNAAKVINKGHLRGFSLPNVHYACIFDDFCKYFTPELKNIRFKYLTSG